MPVIGRPVDVRGRDDAVRCPALIAVAVLNEVPGLGAVARISVSNGSSEPTTNERKEEKKHYQQIIFFMGFCLKIKTCYGRNQL